MSQPRTIRFITKHPIIPIFIQLAAIWWISLYSYPLAHAIIEVYIISISISIFLFGYNSRKLVKEPYTQFLAIAFLFVGTLNMLHLLAQNGDNLFPGHSSVALADHFDATAQLLLVSSLLTGTWFVRRKIRWGWAWVAYGSAAIILIGLPFFATGVRHSNINPQYFPAFKWGGEFLILLILIATIWRLVRVKPHMHPTIFLWMLIACVMLAVQNVLTIIFGQTYQTADLVAHLFKIFAFFALYMSMIFTSISRPFSLLLRTEKEQRDILETEIATRTAELKASEQRFRRLAERLPDMIYRYQRKPTGHYTFISPAIETIFGITADDALRDPHVFADLMPPDTREQWIEIVRNPESFTWYEPVVSKMFHKDGHEIWVEERVTPIYDESGELSGVEGIVRDITAEKQAEEQRRRSTEETIFLHQISVLFNSTLDVDTILKHLAKNVCILFDAYFCAVCKLDERTHELDCYEYAANWDACQYRFPADRGLVGQTIRNKKTLYIPDITENEEISVASAFENSEHPAPRSVLTVPIWAGKKLHAVMQLTDLADNRFSDYDITLVESLANTAGIALENARLYRQAVDDAQTKLTLLKEVNHRVKNNLTTIASLIFLEERKLSGDEYAPFRQSLQDLSSRVRGLAAVHELLSSSEWRPVRLRMLCSDIVSATIRAAADQNQAAVRVTMPDISIQAEQAHHLALVINELTINTLKHGIRADVLLEITISGKMDNTTLTMRYQDNGNGYPAKVLTALANGHTGFELLRNIVTRNLNGHFSIKNIDGAIAEITFQPETLQTVTKW